MGKFRRGRGKRFFSRTVYPSTTIEDIEIGTYTRDPLGKKWDVHRLNKIVCRALSYSGAADGVRVYKLHVRVNYRVRPTVTVVDPSGTITTPSPTITWTYAQSDGDPQSKAEYKIYTADQVGEGNFNPDKTEAVFHRVLEGDILSETLPTSLNPDDYYVYVRAHTAFGCKSVWVGRQFAVAGPAPAPPGNDNAGSAGTPGVGVISVVPDSFRSSATLLMRDASNLLSVQQADFEVSSDPLEYVGSNCTLARDTSLYYPGGVASMSMTSSASGTMSATSTMIEVAPSSPLTVRAQVRSAVSARTVNAVVSFFDSDFASTGSPFTATGTDATGTWTEITANGTSPSTAAYATVKLEVVSTGGASEVHRWDRIGLMYGQGQAWSHGGHMSRNLLDAHASTGDDPVSTQNWVTGNAATSVTTTTTSGTGSHGSKTNRMTYNGVSPTIAFRATGTTFNSVTSGADYTLNKPATVASGDLMLAFVTSTEHGTITAPTGWTTVNTASVDDGSTDVALWVLKRTAGSSEPSSWTDGTLDVTSTRRAAVVVAYSGAADASSQFIAEAARTDAGGGLNHTTASVNNTDPNAWRVAAFASRDDATGTTMTANTQPPSTVLPIAFVGVAAQWGTSSATSSFTINKPAGVQQNDVMIATVAVADPSTCTFTAPTGWTLVRQGTAADTTAAASYAVFRRVAGASEPTSWSGTLSAARRPVTTTAVAYRNVDTTTPILTEGGATSETGSSITTASVTNTDSSAWRVCSFIFSSPGNDASDDYVSTTEVKERYDDHIHYDPTSGSSRCVTIGVADSNAAVSTGSHSRVGTHPEAYYAATAWIGLLKPLSAPPTGVAQTERTDFTAGTSNPWLTTAVYDSNGVVAAGSTSITGIVTPGSGTSVDATASWIGIIRPASPVTSGQVQAYTNSYINLEHISDRVLDLAGNKVTFTAAFKGSTAGTPYLKLKFYRANELLLESIESGTAFGSSAWTKSSATFDLPDGTTRIVPEVSATGRAVADTVDFDRVSVALGSSSVWRNGTGRTAHPVWSVPYIQYADDDGTGYGAWKVLPGISANPPYYDPLTGYLTYEDHTLTPLNNRKYRAQTISYGLTGDEFASGYGPESEEISLEASNWWLKAIDDPDSNMQLKVKRQLSPHIHSTATAFQPLGEDLPVVLSEGYKGEEVEITVLVTRTEYAQLKKLVTQSKTLYLQSDMDNAWWVRPISDLKIEQIDYGKRQTEPLRWVTVTFVQVGPVA